MSAKIIPFPRRPRALTVADVGSPFMPFIVYGLLLMAVWEVWQRR
jgi:hypothetical protein